MSHAGDTDPTIRAKYINSAFHQQNRLLSEIFAQDRVSALMFYAEQQAITADNFDAEYLTPAMAANATGCMAFLLDWSNKNRKQKKDEWSLDESGEDAQI
jgi:hypothetical protein